MGSSRLSEEKNSFFVISPSISYFRSRCVKKHRNTPSTVLSLFYCHSSHLPFTLPEVNPGHGHQNVADIRGVNRRNNSSGVSGFTAFDLPNIDRNQSIIRKLYNTGMSIVIDQTTTFKYLFIWTDTFVFSGVPWTGPEKVTRSHQLTTEHLLTKLMCCS